MIKYVAITLTFGIVKKAMMFWAKMQFW